MAIDMQALLFVLIYQLMSIPKRLRVIWHRAVERFPAGCHEANRAIAEHKDDDIAFVDLAVMESAQIHQVGQFRFAAVSPMFYMVTVEIASVRAARESAASLVA